MAVRTVAELLAEQYRQQVSLMGQLPMERAEQRALAERFTTYLIDEAVEYLHAIGYKMPIGGETEGPRGNRLVDLVDILKYFLALCWTEGVSAEELMEAFESKTAAVEDRHRREVLSTKLCGFDIDGVLADLDGAGYKHAKTETEKAEWFELGCSLLAAPVDGTIDVVNKLKSMGWGIILITSRKMHRTARLESDTRTWLREHGVVYDRLLWGQDKSEVLDKHGLHLVFHVDDHPKHAVDLALSGTKVFLMGGRPGMELAHNNIKRITRAGEILENLDWAVGK